MVEEEDVEEVPILHRKRKRQQSLEPTVRVARVSPAVEPLT